jgi:rod shape-determining protein MreC
MAGSRSAAWFSAVLVAALLLLAGSTLPPAAGVEAQARGLLAPIVDATGELVRPAVNLVSNATEVDRLSNENASLRVQVERLEAELAGLRERERAAAGALALLGSTDRGADEVIVATLLLRDVAPGARAFLVDRGADDGVLRGQPVLGPGGTLIGVVVEVMESESWIRLLTDSGIAVAVVTESSRTPGSLEGDGRRLTLELVERDAVVTVGDLVVTSALGGRMPAGLVAGRVTEVEARPQELFQRVVVEPLSDLRRVEQVLILTDWRPEDAPTTVEGFTP